MTIEDKLGVNKYHTDETNPHIDVDKKYPDEAEIMKVVRACPAGLYKIVDDGTLFFEYLGCLECGTCRVLSSGKLIRDWHYPRGSCGVEYRQG
jgi:ferredoxin-like protein FixX